MGSESLQGLFDKAQEALTTLSKDSDKYKKLLEELLVQGVLQLFEPKVEVITRSGDVQLVQELKSAAEKRYAEETGRKTEITVKEGLSKDSAGGLIVTAHDGRIRLDNTFEQRLRLLEETMMPELRLALYGPNPERKF